MTIAAHVERALAERGIRYRLHPHPRTYSTHDTAQAAHVPEDHIAKAVILTDAHGYAMAVIPGDSWVRLDAVSTEADRRFALAPESEAEGLFPDCAPGAIPPIGPEYGLETFLDTALAPLSRVYFESGDHQQLVEVSGAEFQVLMGGVRRGHFSHEA